MKFARITRPKLGRQALRAKPKVVHEAASTCAWCGAVESYRVLKTARNDGLIVRYSVCTACGGRVTRVFTVPGKA